MSKPTRPFGHRTAKPPGGEPGPVRHGEDSLLPPPVEEYARARKRTLTLSLVTAGALAAAGLWFAEGRAKTCVDDPATPTVDESLPENCRPRQSHWRSSSRWFWTSRSGSTWTSAKRWSLFSSSSSSSNSSAMSHSSPSTSHAVSTTSRGGFGSLGSFHSSGGS